MPKLSYDLDEIQSFTVVPGRYRARLIKVEQTLSAAKNPMLTWYWKIVSGTEKGKDIRSFTSLLENALSNLKMHLEAFGLHGKIKMDTQKLIGKYAVIVVGTRVAPDNSGIERERSSINAVLPDKSSRDEEPEEEYEDEEEDVEDEEAEEEEYEDEDTDDETDDDDEDEEEEERPRRRTSRPIAKKVSRPVAKKAVSKKSGRDRLPF